LGRHAIHRDPQLLAWRRAPAIPSRMGTKSRETIYGASVRTAFGYLEVKCLGCSIHQTVALGIVRRPKTTPVHELERYMRCRRCSEVGGYPYKRSDLVALRVEDCSQRSAAEVWPGER
jgi:hypothetical protein